MQMSYEYFYGRNITQQTHSLLKESRHKRRLSVKAILNAVISCWGTLAYRLLALTNLLRESNSE
jgi:hypothetical protein